MENLPVSPDEIYLASFPFGGSAGMKLRPVLLLTGPIGDVPEVIVAYISSVIPPALLLSDILLDPAVAEYASTNLKTKSVLRLHKLATIHARNMVRRLGALSRTTASEVDGKLRKLLSL
jgi:mRNA-degrading endonuclease toxin of MazEF toxin-antitoxin module